jgi:hypothetical protein
MELITCNVKWNIYIPFNQTLFPYILLTSHGIHTHPPPPPKKTPRAILNGIFNVLQKVDDPGLKAGI